MRPGETVPDFELPDQDGTPRSLSGLLHNGLVVLFFYPAAMTAGCTAESCRFRDLGTQFAALGAQPVGVSPDPVDKQARFAESHSLRFPLLSDESGTVAEQFGVRRGFGPLPVKRHTFVVDRDRSVLHVIRSEFRMAVHADKAIEFLRSRS
ncbi:peroxiredoxin [Actinopolyspora mortivallis]|uniref:thioredoxin-dependent peroxiredoxin n=1 Tax=Actinopolyspora mortivallis TaxID=33906 RepID=A0A2T0H1G2_ACTMO|nr:peroxiredoxin [Actinopolyspora mortivallis]PRW65093.1 peroxiredoxin [Actinopolyspora mortivallis]